jgi:hypothetical protein
MDQSEGWGLSRYVTLLLVLALHVAVLAALIMARETRSISLAENDPVELLFVPPPTIPKIRSESFRPKSLSGYQAIAMEMPALDSISPSPPSAHASASEGNGWGVDWKAEARRALQAYEIRKRQPPSSATLSSPADDNWWPRSRHHAGDQYKTAAGDWVVWINANCYQIASAAAYALGALQPKTVCPDQSKPPRDGDQLPAPQRPHSEE